MAEIYYKDFETNLYAVKNCKGWHIAADNIELALGLANKRGEYNIDDLEQIGTCVTILDTSPKYEDVINMREQLTRAWGLLGHEKSNCNIPLVVRCSLLDDCGKQDWRCYETTSLMNRYRCENCGGTKSVFRNLYPGYQ